ncbi:carboxypeptidase regulatory-like domain-containing protein [Mucilaginibacter sp. BJC16-A38]|uniref:carboxypeptidase regulatory-like domain-containing protein n=1 Tax=Mucilaginibacter phenanthrenivorans TaxID=1234842 RepID=UPI0021580F3B|nr:carboxypeptidase regulatory-like domain-containing protein [Mucilaginibacter phenanthrenivorans]MCR8561017.1 carboxypeptidase regulatory-like domain-containing protein [Mucilaginibacter phenanthrenivorans]
MIKTFIFLIAFLPAVAFGQVSVSGKIISQADTKPVADASVFISNATVGSKTAPDGTFTLKNVKPGQYELVVSIIGFDTYNQTIVVDKSDLDLKVITIYPKSIALNEVKVKPEVDFTRQRNYDWFKEEFLGKTELSKECKILNPEVLDLIYDEKAGVLTASSVDFLVIQNNALGYKIKYLLKDFTLNNADELNKEVGYSGVVSFEPLKGSPAEEQQWENKRAETYRGSVRHFLRSALVDQLDQDGFRVLRLPANPERPADKLINKKIEDFQDEKDKRSGRDSLAYWTKKSNLPKRLQKLLLKPLKEEEFISGADKQGFYTLSNVSASGGNVNDALYVSYDKYHRFNKGTMSKLSDAENKNNTLIIFETPSVPFDKNGNVLDPKDVTYEGVWSRSRLAGMLPLDYEPGTTKALAGDSALINNISSKLNNYAANHLTEKTYLHFDKPYYAAGDTIYFKAYITGEGDHRLSTRSGVLYADLIDPNNKIARSMKLPLADGLAWGDFALADSLKKGNYRVRAYTQLMRNDGDEAFFEQSVPVGSMLNNRVSESSTSKKLPANEKPVVQFFPEGGTLLTGVKSKIAFKAIGPDGFGIDVKGAVLDNEGKEITTFASQHLGMGYFYLEPRENKTYKSKITYADGTEAIIDLPAAGSNGLSMDVTDLSRAYTIKINASKNWYQENRNKNYTLIIYSGGMPFSFAVKLDKQEVGLNIGKKEFRTGVAKATLFSQAGEPLCERLFFVRNDDLLKLGLSTDKSTYATREKVKVFLKTQGNDNAAAPGNFSVAITDEGKLPADENAEPTILNNLLLTSELKGYIEQPNYYFTNINDKTTADLDLVMLTHGYRRFEWKKVLGAGSSNSTPILKPETGLQISGTLTHKSGKPFTGGKLTLFNRSASGTLLLDTVTDLNGRFVFDNLVFGDTTKFVIQALVGKAQNDVVLSVDSTAGPAVNVISSRLAGLVKVDNPMEGYLRNNKLFYEEQKKYGVNKHQVMLKEVVIKDKKTDPSLAHSGNLNGAGNADQVFTSKQLENTSYTTLKDFLAANSPNLEITFDHFLYSRRSVPNFTGQRDMMEIIIDGAPFRQKEPNDPPNAPKPIDWIETGDIESIEIGFGAHYGAIYGSRAAGGVLIITTKRGKNRKYERYTPGVKTYTVNGFYKAREFYSPQYDNPKTNQKMADLRSTIYWNPNVVTDKDGKASFSFFNADGKGTYRVVIEGIDADGNLGRQVYRYKVE